MPWTGTLWVISRSLASASAPCSCPAGASGAPAQIALAWTVGLAPNVLLIPGTSSVAHLEENLAAADVALDEQAHRELAAAQ